MHFPNLSFVQPCSNTSGWLSKHFSIFHGMYWFSHFYCCRKSFILAYKHSCVLWTAYLALCWFREMWGVSNFLTISLLPCARYMNALDAGVTEFSEKLNFKEILRTSEQLKQIVKNPNRKSNGKEGLRLHCPCKWIAFPGKSNTPLS